MYIFIVVYLLLLKFILKLNYAFLLKSILIEYNFLCLYFYLLDVVYLKIFCTQSNDKNDAPKCEIDLIKTKIKNTSIGKK